MNIRAVLVVLLLSLSTLASTQTASAEEPTDEALLEEAQAIVERKKLTSWEGFHRIYPLLRLLLRWHDFPSGDDETVAAILDRRDPVPFRQASLRVKAYELIGNLTSAGKGKRPIALAAFRRAEWIAATHLPENAEHLASLQEKIAHLQRKEPAGAEQGTNDAPKQPHPDEAASPPARAAVAKAFATAEARRLQTATEALPESEVFLQVGHSHAISRLAWSPDDAYIATVSADNAVKLWDVDASRLVYTYRGHGSLVNAVAFTPDGAWIVTGAARPDSSLHVIERRSGRMLHRLAGHTSGVQDIAILPDGQRALSVSDDGGQAILWDLTTATMLRKYQFEGLGNLRSVAVLPDGKHALVGSWVGHIALISLEEERILRTYPKQTRVIAQIAVHPDGGSFFTAIGGDTGAMAGEGAVIRWALDSDEQLYRYDGPGPKSTIWGVAVSPDGTMLAAGAGNSQVGGFSDGVANDEIWLWRIENGAQQARWRFNERWTVGGITALAFSSDGTRLAYSENDSNSYHLAVRTLQTDALAQISKGRQNSYRLLAAARDGSVWRAVSISNKKLADQRRLSGDLKSPLLRNYIGNFIQVDGVYRLMRWDLSSGERVETIDDHADRIHLLSAVDDGTLSLSHSWRARDEERLTMVATRPNKDAVLKRFSEQLDQEEVRLKQLALSRTGRRMAVAHEITAPGFAAPPVFFVAIYEQSEQGYRLLRKLPVALPVTALAFGADERYLLAGVCEAIEDNFGTCDKSKGVRLHCADIDTGHWFARAERVPRQIAQIRISPDGAYALTTGAHSVVWRTDNCQFERELWAGDTRFTTAGAWSPDQRRIAVASHGRRIRLWDATTVSIVRVLEDFDGRVVQLDFTPDGETLLALTDDGALRLWDPDTGALRATMIEFDDGEWMTITPEGYFTGSPGADRQLNVRYGDRVYGMDQFYDVFYRPDIVRRKLAGEKIDDLIRTTLDEAVRRPPPRVAVTAQPDADGRVRLKLEASDAGGGVGALRVYHNGKLVASDDVPRTVPLKAALRPAAQGTAAVRRLLAAEAKRAKPAAPEPQRLKEVDIRLAPGENRVWVTGLNADGSLRSRPLVVELPSRPAAPARVFVLALGVDRYRQTRDIPTLRYAVKDARTFAREMRERLAKVFPQQPVEVRYLENEKATLANLQTTLERLREEMRPGDVFVWFIASHGMLDEDSVYNVVLHDADLDRPGRGMLPADRLAEWLKRLPALDQIVVIDTCHAGGLDNTLRGLYDARFGVLARSMGLHILASASATEEAIDGYKGNGLFTHSMLQAMNDPGSDSNADRRLSVTELGRYARALTHRIARQMRYSQNPLVFHFGRDLVVAEFEGRR
jgi:WD40 repeat protein